VSSRNKKLAELKDTSTDRIEAANQDRGNVAASESSGTLPEDSNRDVSKFGKVRTSECDDAQRPVR
jgi:hypothetical protein